MQNLINTVIPTLVSQVSGIKILIGNRDHTHSVILKGSSFVPAKTVTLSS